MTSKLSRHWFGSSFGHSPVQRLQAALGGLKTLRMRFDGVFQQALAQRDIALLDGGQRQPVQEFRPFGPGPVANAVETPWRRAPGM